MVRGQISHLAGQQMMGNCAQCNLPLTDTIMHKWVTRTTLSHVWAGRAAFVPLCHACAALLEAIITRQFFIDAEREYKEEQQKKRGLMPNGDYLTGDAA